MSVAPSELSVPLDLQLDPTAPNFTSCTSGLGVKIIVRWPSLKVRWTRLIEVALSLNS
ncbi:MAG: hypothetical protein ACYCO3_10405 [Mycobacteriales bacterium]